MHGRRAGSPNGGARRRAGERPISNGESDGGYAGASWRRHFMQYTFLPKRAGWFQQNLTAAHETGPSHDAHRWRDSSKGTAGATGWSVRS